MHCFIKGIMYDWLLFGAYIAIFEWFNCSKFSLIQIRRVLSVYWHNKLVHCSQCKTIWHCFIWQIVYLLRFSDRTIIEWAMTVVKSFEKYWHYKVYFIDTIIWIIYITTGLNWTGSILFYWSWSDMIWENVRLPGIKNRKREISEIKRNVTVRLYIFNGFQLRKYSKHVVNILMVQI